MSKQTKESYEKNLDDLLKFIEANSTSKRFDLANRANELGFRTVNGFNFDENSIGLVIRDNERTKPFIQEIKHLKVEIANRDLTIASLETKVALLEQTIAHNPSQTKPIGSYIEEPVKAVEIAEENKNEYEGFAKIGEMLARGDFPRADIGAIFKNIAEVGQKRATARHKFYIKANYAFKDVEELKKIVETQGAQIEALGAVVGKTPKLVKIVAPPDMLSKEILNQHLLSYALYRDLLQEGYTDDEKGDVFKTLRNQIREKCYPAFLKDNPDINGAALKTEKETLNKEAASIFKCNILAIPAGYKWEWQDMLEKYGYLARFVAYVVKDFYPIHPNKLVGVLKG